ncbi:MAG: thioredoxin family protein [Polyangiaceae bacterium]|nr:thioredoxin family protein [Polyangiaceae bacterium]
MAAVPSRMILLESPLPSFALPDVVSGEIVTDARLRAAPVSVVAFICNHCPYVVHVQPELVRLGRDLAANGVAMVAISSNDVTAVPEDGPQQMAALARRVGFTFPYLFDENQAVALAFQAACTPDFFVFDSAATLAYRGQLDASRPGNARPLDGSDLRAAVEALLGGGRPAAAQRPSVGCSLKWSAGRAPPWA